MNANMQTLSGVPETVRALDEQMPLKARVLVPPNHASLGIISQFS